MNPIRWIRRQPSRTLPLLSLTIGTLDPEGYAYVLGQAPRPRIREKRNRVGMFVKALARQSRVQAFKWDERENSAAALRMMTHRSQMFSPATMSVSLAVAVG